MASADKRSGAGLSPIHGHKVRSCDLDCTRRIAVQTKGVSNQVRHAAVQRPDNAALRQCAGLHGGLCRITD